MPTLPGNSARNAAYSQRAARYDPEVTR